MPASIRVKTILNKTKRRDPWFLDNYTINPYSSCSFNCLYCYIRGSKYGENLAEKVSVKSNAPGLLEKQLSLRAKKNQYGVIVLASATDPYLHFEEEILLSRHILEIIYRFRFPVHIITKSPLVLRDLDLLNKINQTAILPMDLRDNLKSGAFVTFSFSTIDENVGKIFEPGAPQPQKRLDAMKQVYDSGLLTGVSMMPLLPYISDTAESLESMFRNFKTYGAQYVLPASVSLFGNNSSDSKVLMMRAIQKNYSSLYEKYQRFFKNSDQMPNYYTLALYKKLKELSEKYQLRNAIV